MTTPQKTAALRASAAQVDPDRVCELCGGQIMKRNTTGVCRTKPACRKENSRRRDKAYEISRECKVCGGPLSPRNKIGICRRNPECRKEAKKARDRLYHSRHGRWPLPLGPVLPPGYVRNGRRPHRATHRPSPGDCRVCGHPLRYNNNTGVDERTAECRTAHSEVMRQRAAEYRARPGGREKARANTRAWQEANPERFLVGSLRDRAREQAVRFSEQAVLALGEPPKSCPQCGVAMARVPGKPGGVPTSPAVYRAIPERGYVAGNLFWTCLKCCLRRKAAS